MSKYAELCKCGHARGEHSEGDWACFESECSCHGFEYATEGSNITKLVIEDIMARERIGKKQCSQIDALLYAYQEALDVVMYLREVIERKVAK